MAKFHYQNQVMNVQLAIPHTLLQKLVHNYAKFYHGLWQT